MTGVARSEETLAGITAAGALAVRGDVTDQASVRGGARAGGRGARLGRSRLQRRGRLRRRPQRPVRRRADLRRPARGVRFLGRRPGPLRLRLPLGDRRVPARAGHARNGDSGNRRLVAPRRRRAWPLGRRRVRREGDHPGGCARATRARHSRRAADHRRRIQPIADTGPVQDAAADPRELAAAVLFLAEQGARAATHELQVTPLAERWVP